MNEPQVFEAVRPETVAFYAHCRVVIITGSPNSDNVLQELIYHVFASPGAKPCMGRAHTSVQMYRCYSFPFHVESQNIGLTRGIRLQKLTIECLAQPSAFGLMHGHGLHVNVRTKDEISKRLQD